MENDYLPKVSILIPCYNSGKYLSEAIESAINQNWQDLEIIIADNKSSDDSVQIAQQYASEDARIRVIVNNENLGPTRNWLNLAKEAQGELVVLLFSDDILDKDYLKFLVPPLNSDDIAFAFCAAWMIDTVGAKIGMHPMYSGLEAGSFSTSFFIDGHLLLGGDIFPLSPGCAIFRKKDMINALDYFFDDEFNLGFSSHGAGPDLGIYLFTAMKYPLIAYVGKSLAKFRSHQNNLSKLQNVRISYAIFKSKIASIYYYGNTIKLSSFRSAHFFRLLRLGRIGLYIPSMRWDVDPLRLNFKELIKYVFRSAINKLIKHNQASKKLPTLYETLTVVNELVIPGYIESVPRGSIWQIDFYKRDTCDWYQNFIKKAIAAQKISFMPIYRMADGEFIFSVGRRTPLITDRNRFLGFIIYLIKLTRIKINSLFGEPETTCWGESYKKDDLIALKKNYVKSLQAVSSSGYLAIHFTRTQGRFSEEYTKPVCEWFERANIELTVKNYVPFYFIYALLCGPESERLIRNKNILVITSANQEKRDKISSSLNLIGANSVDHYGISEDNAMNELIDPYITLEKYDLILVAAGIGSVNILAQLKRSKTLCIDAGIFIEILANPEKRNRIFTIPDGFK